MPTAAELHQTWQGLPWADATTLPAARRPLILAPHPDDETLGCGGFIAACCAAGRPPVVAVLTDGAASHPDLPEATRQRLRLLREQEVRRATGFLGLPPANLILLGLPDAGLAQAAGPCARVLTHLAQSQGCDLVMATSRHDPHADHQAAAALAASVAASLGLPCRFYPTWAWTLAPETLLPVAETRGARFNIAAWLGVKRRAMVAHESQYFGLPDDPGRRCLPASLLAVAQRDYEVLLTA
jgi:LmbE family N-acetylglucosaminyl deacetylase